MAGRRASQGLDSLPSSSSMDLYESAEEHSLPASRGNSFSGALPPEPPPLPLPPAASCVACLGLLHVAPLDLPWISRETIMPH